MWLFSTTKNILMNNIQNTAITFNGKNISSYAWWITVLDFLEKIGIWELCDKRLTNASGKEWVWRTMEFWTQATIHSLIKWFSLWAKHITDISLLVDDPLTHIKNRSISSQGTLSKRINDFNQITEMQLYNIHNRIVHQYFTTKTKEKKLEVLNISDDSSAIETHGKQEWSEYIHHYGLTWFHPDFVTEDEMRLVLTGVLRDGNVYSANKSEFLIQEVFKRYSKFTDLIVFRADSAYGKKDILDVLHSYVERWNKVEAYVKAKTYSWWLVNCEQKEIWNWKEYLLLDLPIEYFQELNDEGEKVLVDRFFTIQHQASGRIRKEKVVVRMRRHEGAKGSSLFACVHKDVEFLIVIGEKKWKDAFDEYGMRWKQEQIIEELKNDAFLTKLSHHWKAVNSCIFLIKIIVHNLLQIMRLETLAGTKYANCKTRTLRKILVNVWWKIVYHARKVYIKLSSVFLYKERYIIALERLRVLQLWLA